VSSVAGKHARHNRPGNTDEALHVGVEHGVDVFLGHHVRVVLADGEPCTATSHHQAGMDGLLTGLMDPHRAGGRAGGRAEGGREGGTGVVDEHVDLAQVGGEGSKEGRHRVRGAHILWVG
jgi:hypothetical protein